MMKKVRKKLTNFFEGKDLAWYTVGIDKLTNQYKNCLARYGNYVEK